MLQVWMPDTDDVWHWAIDGTWSAGMSLEQLTRELSVYQGQAAVVYFASRHVQLLKQSMSKSQYKQLGSIGASYMLEEYVVLPLDAMLIKQQFVAPDQLYLMGIAKTTAETLQHALSLLPVKLSALLPDFLLVPEPAPNQIYLLNLAGRLLARDSAYSGSSIDDLQLYLEYQLLQYEYAYHGLTEQQLAVLATLKTQNQHQPYDNQLPVLKRPERHVWNIMTRQVVERTTSRYWGWCAALLGGVILTQLAVDGLRWYQAKNVAEQTAVQAVEQYQAWFGAQSRVSEQNLKSQFESQLRLNQSADTQALNLISRVGPVLMQHQAVAQQMNYDEQGLRFALVAASSQKLQDLTVALGKQGFKVQLGNISTQGNSVIGQLSIQ